MSQGSSCLCFPSTGITRLLLCPVFYMGVGHRIQDLMLAQQILPWLGHFSSLYEEKLLGYRNIYHGLSDFLIGLSITEHSGKGNREEIQSLVPSPHPGTSWQLAARHLAGRVLILSNRKFNHTTDLLTVHRCHHGHQSRLRKVHL